MLSTAELEEHIPSLRRYAFALLRDRADADDLVQDCLVRALDRARTKAVEGSTRAWLFTIMHNLSVSRWRRLRSRAAWLAADPDADAAVAPAQEHVPDLRTALDALDRLPDEQRRVMLLVAVEGFGYAEAAQILGVPVGTVMSRLSRGRDRLRELLGGAERPRLRTVT